MINFRYHLVSLIAVFLALAVGVVLGAGPLQNAISAQGEKTVAATSQAELESALRGALSLSEEAEVFTEAVGDQVLPKTLEGQTVAIVALPGVTDEELLPLISALETAGSAVEGTVWLTDAFVSQDQNTYRDTLASPVSAHLTKRPVDGAAANVLASGLVEVLTSTGGQTELIKEIMADEAIPLVEPGSFPADPVEVLVLVGPTGGATDADANANGEDEGVGEQSGGGSLVSSAIADLAPMTRDAWIALGTAIGSGATKSVALGQAGTADELIAVLRANDVGIATVDQGGTQMGALNAALVLATGASGAYGQQEGAKEILAPLP